MGFAFLLDVTLKLSSWNVEPPGKDKHMIASVSMFICKRVYMKITHDKRNHCFKEIWKKVFQTVVLLVVTENPSGGITEEFLKFPVRGELVKFYWNHLNKLAFQNKCFCWKFFFILLSELAELELDITNIQIDLMLLCTRELSLDLGGHRSMPAAEERRSDDYFLLWVDLFLCVFLLKYEF